MSVILPGSYDPVTLGHLDVIRRTAQREEKVYVVIFNNPNKTYRFSLDDRVRMLMLATEEYDNILVSYSAGLVIDYMREHGIEKIVKGYRNQEDIRWEEEQAAWNFKHGGYPTELVECSKEYREVSSTLVRQRLDLGEDVSDLLHPKVAEYIENLK